MCLQGFGVLYRQAVLQAAAEGGGKEAHPGQQEERRPFFVQRAQAVELPEQGCEPQGVLGAVLALKLLLEQVRLARPARLAKAEPIRHWIQTLFLNLSQYKIFRNFMLMRAKTICEF